MDSLASDVAALEVFARKILRKIHGTINDGTKQRRQMALTSTAVTVSSWEYHTNEGK